MSYVRFFVFAQLISIVGFICTNIMEKKTTTEKTMYVIEKRKPRATVSFRQYLVCVSWIWGNSSVYSLCVFGLCYNILYIYMHIILLPSLSYTYICIYMYMFSSSI